eukprot:Nitzschia sp. Nitz4//scaffold25_size161228//3967//7344//NITZ4_002409-RA/size161228-processed-gene-0.175-mRNA-1//-1//CDS//3329544523//3416//frame0
MEQVLVHNATTSITTNATGILLERVEQVLRFRQELFLWTIEPIIVLLLGPVEPESEALPVPTEEHRRLTFDFIMPNYDENPYAYQQTTLSFAALTMLFVIMTCILLIFMSCFYHNQKTSPLFISPRRHRLPKLVPPPMPVDGYFEWIKVCFFLSDEEIIQRVGFDTLIFLRFHRLALRCIVKMSIFSFIVLLPLNYTGRGRANAKDLKDYVGIVLNTDFLRFTMANVSSGSPRLWVHCFAAYLLTGIVVRELLVEYETFNSIRHCYLLSREPHLRTVLVTNIPRHLRSAAKINTYFRHVYPNAVQNVVICQNVLRLESLVEKRTSVLSRIEKELLFLCRVEKTKLFERSRWSKASAFRLFGKLEDYGIIDGSQERLANLYSKLEELNAEIENEQRRRARIMKRMDQMEAGEGRKEIDYILASPFVSADDPHQRRVLGLMSNAGQQLERVGGYNPPSSQHNQVPPVSSVPSHDTMVSTDMDNEIFSGPSSSMRARSPLPKGIPEDQPYSTEVPQSMSRKSKPIVKAKSAIRRYSRLARDVSFFGRPIRSTIALQSDGHIEEHINEVTDKAFVVMRTFTAATIAIQSMHSSKPGAMQVTTAPEPRDVLWGNIYISKGAMRARSLLGEFLVILVISFYSVPVVLVSFLVSESALVASSPRLAQLDQATALFSSAIAMVQPMCIVTLQQLLPPLFISISQLEGLVSFSDVQMRAFSRYFLFQVVNVFLVTTIAGSLFETIAQILNSPETAFEMLGDSLPAMSSYFITFVTIKAFFGLGLELVRTMALCQAVVRYGLVPDPTLRQARSIVAGMRAIDDPGWFPFHKILAQDLLVVVIAVVFAVVAPLVLLPCALFFSFSRIMWTHHHLYVYESVFESGGQFWPKIFRRFIFGLIIAQMTITGQFILKDARHEAYATIALMFMTYLFLRNTRARYDPTSSTLPLEVATVMDISLSQEEEARKRAQAEESQPSLRPPVASARSHEISELQSQGTDSLADNGTMADDSELGTNIGGCDPFDQAFLQPALRANPHARPEQPFPPAQLGREDALFGPQQSGESQYLDSRATVRLKSMNQEDRRLTNRWWKDQLQRAGDQNILSILVGEECGTLTLGKRTALHERNVPLGPQHQFV